jgi:hypothetical protein
VQFDEYLSFNANISSVCAKISKSCLNRIKNFVTPSAMKMLYFAMVYSILISYIVLKVHKIENFFDSDFGICVISLLVMHK